jgi:hypothetical protein
LDFCVQCRCTVEYLEHGSSNCHLDPACVKCASPHETSACTVSATGAKVPEDQLKCANSQQTTVAVQFAQNYIISRPKKKQVAILVRQDLPHMLLPSFRMRILEFSGSQWSRSPVELSLFLPTAREEVSLPMISRNSEIIFFSSHRPEIVSSFAVT